jgi:hypothetical protein
VWHETPHFVSRYYYKRNLKNAREAAQTKLSKASSQEGDSREAKDSKEVAHGNSKVNPRFHQRGSSEEVD